MTRIILVRHGETPWNVEGRFQGQNDTPLSERGLKQAKLLAQALKDVHIDVAISSPLQRAYITCKECADLHDLDIITDERLAEINHGEWEGSLAKDIAAIHPKEFETWHSSPHLIRMATGAETLEEVCNRSRSAFERYTKEYDKKTILVVSHDAVNKAIICDLLGMGLDKFWQIKQDNTCINVLEHNNDKWRLVLLNSTNHLGFLFSDIEQAGL